MNEWDGQRRRSTNAGPVCGASCGWSDPSTDTVKVQAPLESPSQDLSGEAAQREEEFAAQWRASEKAEDAQREAELEAQWNASEQVKRQVAEELRQKEEAEAARRQAELKAEQEARELAAARAAEQAKRQKEEEARVKAQEAAHRKVESRRKQVEAWLKEHGYSGGARDPKKTCFKKKYPIHSAAKRGEHEIIEILIEEGANPADKDSKGKTALAIAEKKNKGSSHQGAIQVLTAKLGSAA
mmetsp:Transcript_58642/g.136373  ORF Transcript_58642/g.136373 Transcript_58642/m.136373 type:complete len:241 (-) Transcript_58642:257-979(-)